MRRRRRGEGSVVAPKTPGGTWAIRYSEDGHRVFDSGYTSEHLATLALKAREVDRARDKIGLPPDRSRLPTLSQLAPEWLDRHVISHQAGKKERRIWKRHLEPEFGKLRAPDLDRAALRRYVTSKRAAGLKPATVRYHVRILSAFWSDLAERPRETGATDDNPCKGLPRTLTRLIRSDYDPRLTPYVEKLSHVKSIYLSLAEPYRTAYAIGALAGLRTSEVLALDWDRHIDLELRRIIVREQVKDGKLGSVKNHEARILPIAPELLSVLRTRKLAGAKGLVVPPARPGRRSGPKKLPARFARSQTLNGKLHTALAAVGLGEQDLDWYRATRHTYASHYVLHGGTLEHLTKLLGHASAEVTQRYAHLRPEAISQANIDRIPVDLLSPDGAVAALPVGQRTGRDKRHDGAVKRT